MSIFKTQPHQQYAFQLFPPSTQPVTAQPIINGSYRQRKGLHIIGSCCLISRRRLRTRLSSFSYRQHQSPASTCCLLLRYSWLCSSRGCFLAFLVTRDKSVCRGTPGRVRVGWMEVGGKGSTHGCPGKWLYPCIGRMLYDGVMHVPGDSLAAQSSPRCPCCHSANYKRSHGCRQRAQLWVAEMEPRIKFSWGKMGLAQQGQLSLPATAAPKRPWKAGSARPRRVRALIPCSKPGDQ